MSNRNDKDSIILKAPIRVEGLEVKQAPRSGKRASGCKKAPRSAGCAIGVTPTPHCIRRIHILCIEGDHIIARDYISQRCRGRGAANAAVNDLSPIVTRRSIRNASKSGSGNVNAQLKSIQQTHKAQTTSSRPNISSPPVSASSPQSERRLELVKMIRQSSGPAEDIAHDLIRQGLPNVSDTEAPDVLTYLYDFTKDVLSARARAASSLRDVNFAPSSKLKEEAGDLGLGQPEKMIDDEAKEYEFCVCKEEFGGLMIECEGGQMRAVTTSHILTSFSSHIRILPFHPSVQCISGCWFHLSCVGITDVELLPRIWFFPTCWSNLFGSEAD
ncbi:hypothetical protein BDK51DRAFT_33644 [Blyttiomyces helicus]|uniref:Uncharacterized protein n=1 Tax=Blyttiomyces helicus TaxID=388810 RepID=A0A4P9W381_9FUNG|nr:hypothetical protein BDK51DRAFT_33644 [Blyttiomyces helicus]|eukprot:RKO85683.1 hypothetical protein BDK51DRAFT_33644 [Blyttiomyces helicus]